jgi:two-component system response regulator AtoC
MELFLAYHWPGNVRQLENVIRRAIVLRDWEIITKDLELKTEDLETASRLVSNDKTPAGKWDDNMARSLVETGEFSLKKLSKAYVSGAERQAMLSALSQTHWNRKKAAQLLKVSYKTLLNRIDEFDLKP